MTNFKVGYLIGSLATASINRKLAKALIRLAPEELEFTRDPVQGPAALQLRLRRRLSAGGASLQGGDRRVDAMLFVTPEYNRSIPGGLKNAIDWASRPYGTNSFTRKPSAVIGTSPGAIGTAVAQQSLRSVLELLQLAADERARGLYPVHARPDHRRRRGDRRVDRGIPAQLHGRVPRLHHAGLHGHSAPARQVAGTS